MGFIYKIEINNEIYIGSTKQKYLSDRQSGHNQALRNQKCREYNSHIYKYCRTHNIEKIICELIEEVDDTELKILEQEYIKMLEPSLNTYRAYRTEEEVIQYAKGNKIKSNCPICNKEMLKRHIKLHIQRKHNI
jgi:hypothetical protein|tara:strand:- start:620 stop:1021 length:402 start_codon:yes stop_codon:yes gene_type:complete